MDPIMQLATLIAAIVLLVLQQRTGSHAKQAARDAAAANDAVNRTHPKDDQPRIYDIALENRKHLRELKAQLEAHIKPDAECVLKGCLRTEMASEDDDKGSR